jgi:hypothetical protein
VADAPESTIKESAPTRQVGIVPRKSSSKEAKMNLKEEPPTREFIESQKREIQDGLRRQIEAARRSLAVETDGKRIAEIQNRVRAAEKSIADLDAVDPGNAATWNVGEKH